MQITVTVTGRLYSVTTPGTLTLELPPGATLDDALAATPRTDRGPLGWPPQAMLAVSGEHVGTLRQHAPRRLVEGDEVLVFTPVAGG